ncbi:MAG TPA: OB-fold nucleic acid binding domain-containing protein, partial [Lachnospiraceae bacterium]|nr:OB-fold nucleic acid binding domain-containing protein [Lachnospiraceae bacterium]
IYVSGHPLEADEAMWRKHISAYAADFTLDEETGVAKAEDQAKVTVGGVIEEKTIKYTKTGKNMAFIVLEDLTGKVEVIIWPNDYEKNAKWLIEDSKVFIQGRVSAEEEKDAKLICERITPFENIPKKLWVKFKTKEEYVLREQELLSATEGSDGNDTVVIYIEETKEIKNLPRSRSVHADEGLVSKLSDIFGDGNIKVV